MESLYLLIPLSIVLVFAIGIVFWWSLRSGQFEDLEGPAYRILMDDDKPAEPGESSDTPDAMDAAGKRANRPVESHERPLT